ncbi:SDR family NAD(P)-dependent oxidoreductase [Acidaminobacter hydrogenoformans]|uniref:NAD(P)-dependent dehydrogenase, short-chain alcohol dehydrogenase family n=1 Tax=Acidaminobacter hydrogenoformans DSM 2784 TaxID=1120920 RepID=A0A1G5RXL4_9FIRM|nr:SDR family oxidoreductase [Acidaminobacter hydrogenoformans]SCZ78598.1 NAD(P)-dependent dehydrogenase, short-chain alcohol dehydrogenase family [Acidaminobacter hydrogenoformans DSM 2784]
MIDQKFIDKLFEVKGKVALITGATGALGKAVATGYGAAGMKVFVTGRGEDKCKALCSELAAQGIECAYSTGDPAVEADVVKVVGDAVAAFGEINVLVTAAGYNHAQPIVEQDLAEWKKIMDSDVQGTWLFCKYVGKQMIEQGKGGKVVLVSSARSKMGMAGYTGYATAKAGIDLMAQSLACEWTAKYNINVNTINPTVFRSDLTEWMFDPESEVYKNFLRRLPIGRLGEPEDFVGPCLFLASSASDFMTGANVAVEGGYWAN